MNKKNNHNLSLKLIFLVALLLGSCIITEPSFAQNFSSSELINNAKQMDGQRVIYKGEVIGEVMIRGDFAWINLNDGVNAVGIWVNRGLIKDVFYAGSYKFRGDILEIEGIFHRSCPEHGGDFDIHADIVRKVESGKNLTEVLDVKKRNFIFVLLGVLCLVLILNLLKVK